MKREVCGPLVLADCEPTSLEFAHEFVAGLRRRPKTLPCKYFYDERGSRLFDQICQLDEYYVARTEMGILRAHIAEIASALGPRCAVIEPGSGSSEKTRLLLDHLDSPVAYVPMDISREHMVRAAAALQYEYPGVEILPVCADYLQPLTPPLPSGTAQRKAILFPGSTLGNFHPVEAVRFLQALAGWCEPGDGLLIGVDLEKSATILEPAYNDARGITAAFNLNLLQRANAELGAGFVLDQFRHEAPYSVEHHRIEMCLVSQRRQCVHVAGELIEFEEEERITTEYSYKYRLETLGHLAAAAGWSRQRIWTDPNRWFSVQYLVREGG
jgi:dimethylhistidine N-methyltransferase